MLKFDVYHEDDKTGRIELDGVNLIKKECYLGSDVKYLFILFPFYNMTTGMQVVSYLKKRIVQRDRDGVKDLLKRSGINEYNFYEILKKTKGSDPDDMIWFKFDGDNSNFSDTISGRIRLSYSK